MGYYARSTEANFFIPADKVDLAFEAYLEWKHLFPEQWAKSFFVSDFAGIEEVLNDLGFDTAEEDGGVRVVSFDAKWRYQDDALTVFKDFVDADSYISFIGEESDLWRWTPEGVKNAVISWV